MTRTHPPTLLRIAERTIVDEGLFQGASKILVAVSGGPDSTALLHVLARLRAKLGIELVAHGVDHGLRKEAAAELRLAEEVARSLNVPFATTKVELVPGSNLQARARAARLEALRAAKEREGAQLIATAHHADDRAETVLMRLLRGSGPDGLAVLPPRSNDLVRPFVRARRADIIAHLRRHRLPYAEDPSNQDPRFLRTRVRHELLPQLEALSPRIVEHLCALADALTAPSPAPVPATLFGKRLGRAHRKALEQALRTRNARARIPLPGGGIAGLDLATGQIVLMKKP